MPELSDWLIRELQLRPWLLVLDGLERILVQYNRLDAAQMRDEEAETATDPLLNRDPCQAIRPDDDDLLRRLTAITSSKILVSTRLLPLGLTNSTGATLPGVRRVLLQGLRPPDAEALFKACGIRGSSARIRSFLQANCDCHPLVIGALAGLVNDYLPDKGNFDGWVDDPEFGGKLNLADLDLRARREHILEAAIAALEPKARKLLQRLALLLGGAEYAVLEALNPYLPPRPSEIEKPEHPSTTFDWLVLNDAQRQEAMANFESTKAHYDRYCAELNKWQQRPATRLAPRRLQDTVLDLERRGLLQYDRVSRRYDLHPVVRGVTAGRMNAGERTVSGKAVVDCFSARTPDTWANVKSLAEVADGVQLVSTLIGMGEFERACDVYGGELAQSLYFNIEAQATILSLIKGWFPHGWESPPSLADEGNKAYILTAAGHLFREIDSEKSLFLHQKSMEADLRRRNSYSIGINIHNIARLGRLSSSIRILQLGKKLAHGLMNEDLTFILLLANFELASIMGDFDAATLIWGELRQLRTPTSRALYRLGHSETALADSHFRRGILRAKTMDKAEALAIQGHNRFHIRSTARLRGRWFLERGCDADAVTHLAQAVTMAREVELTDPIAEAALALAQFRNNRDPGLEREAERLDGAQGCAAIYLSELWQGLGQSGRAVDVALRAHEWALGDGEPYVRRWELDRARRLLVHLGVELPELRTYDPSGLAPHGWEKDVIKFIDEWGRKRAALKRRRKRTRPTRSS